jgi:hypothetical protein
VQLTVPYKDLTPREDEARILYDVDYVAIASRDNGEEIDRVENELTVSFEPGRKAELAAVRLSIEEILEVPEGSYRVVAYVRDRNRDRIGNAEFPLQVPPRPAEGIFLSTVFVAGEILAGNPTETRPFQFGAIRVIPEAERSFTAEDTLKLYLEAYRASTAEDGRKRLRVDFFVMRDGRLVLGVPASFLRPDSEPVGITGQIPLRKCTPGDYVIRVRVTDETNGARAESEAPFTIR